MKKRNPFLGRHLAVLFLFWVLGLASHFGSLLPRAEGQGNLDFSIYQTLQTGGGQTLTSANQILNLDRTKPSGRLQFSFFYASQEQPVAGQFLDSATIMLQDGAQTTALVFLTVDANGVYWAPATPGGLNLDPASMVMTPLSYHDQSQEWQLQTAYSITMALPEQLNTGAALLTLDLFDNGNSLNSMAWISQVPEPSAPTLLLFGGLVWSLSLMRKARGRFLKG